MPKDVDIQPGQTFHLPAAQQKNLSTLLGVLSKKEVNETITTMCKTEKEMWKDMKETVVGLKDFVSMGGVSSIKQEFTEIVTFQLDYFLAPLKNEFDQLIADALAPIMVKLNDIINTLASWLTDNSEGSLIGGIVGGVAGLWLPGGAIWTILGAVLGAALQSYFQSIMGSLGTIEPSENIMDPMAVARYVMETGQNWQGLTADYMAWYFSTYYPDLGFI